MSVSCSDATAGIATSACPANQTFSSDGSSTATASVSDNAGNSSSASFGPILIDKTAPLVTATPDRAANSNGWYNAPVKSTFSGDDGSGSGVARCDAAKTYSGPDNATASVTGACADVAGNVGSVTVNLKYDATQPTITYASRTTPNAAGWNNSAVTVNWSCGDATSGATSASVSQTVSGEGANQSATGTCADNAGNSISNTQTGINIDKTAPTLNPVVSPNPAQMGGSATVTANAADALSGLASQSCGTLDTTTAGTKTVTCTATDNAGNPASATVTYQVAYRWSGFFQPVDNLPTVNSVKAGSAIPVKFSLGGNQGLNIFAVGYPASQQIACSSGAPVAEIEQTVTAAASGLSYDAASDTYTYVWKTQKNWAGTCRQLVVRLIDGSEHIASFQFR